jgi:hypothetical protein
MVIASLCEKMTNKTALNLHIALLRLEFFRLSGGDLAKIGETTAWNRQKIIIG